MANEVLITVKHKKTGKTLSIAKNIFDRTNGVGGFKDYEILVNPKKVEKAIEEKITESEKK